MVSLQKNIEINTKEYKIFFIFKTTDFFICGLFFRKVFNLKTRKSGEILAAIILFILATLILHYAFNLKAIANKQFVTNLLLSYHLIKVIFIVFGIKFLLYSYYLTLTYLFFEMKIEDNKILYRTFFNKKLKLEPTKCLIKYCNRFKENSIILFINQK